MKQFILSSMPDTDGIVRLSGKDYHYLARVRRLKKGTVFTAVLPGGEKTELTVLSVGDNVLSARCGLLTGESQTGVFRKNEAAPKLPPIILFQGLPKGTKMDLIVRQAAEGGIAVVAPFQSANSTAKTGSAEKLYRWERIVKEARQQSGSLIPTAVRPPCPVDGILDYWEKLRGAEPRTLGILFHQDNLTRETLAEGSFHGYLYNDPLQIVLAVGPEGGFSPEEADKFIMAGFRPLVMGNTILRAETAALYGAAAVRIILLENASWALKKAMP